MNLTLGEQDRDAIDLIVDRAPQAVAGGRGGGSPAVYAAADPSMARRVAQAQKVLALLQLLPAAEPPADLLNRTLQFVERPERRSSPLRSDVPTLVDSQRPIV